jgi:clan AA aspartic protease (TIGR02281 family)
MKMKTVFVAALLASAMLAGQAAHAPAHAGVNECIAEFDTLRPEIHADNVSTCTKAWATPTPVASPAPVPTPAPKPTPGGRYFIDRCSNSANAADTWSLGFDTKLGEVEFWPDAHPDSVRWGPIGGHSKTTFTAVIGDPKAPMNLAYVDLAAGGRLTWVDGLKSGIMTCKGVSESDARPAVWHDLDAPAAVAPDVKPSSLPLLFARGGAYVAVSIGTTAANMLVDTGATDMTVSESIANSLIASGQATEQKASEMVLAGGAKKSFRHVAINTVTVGGHEVKNVEAAVTPDGSDMLLGLGVLAQLAPKFGINVANSTLDLD